MITFFVSLLNNLDAKRGNGVNCLHLVTIPKKLVMRTSLSRLILKIQYMQTLYTPNIESYCWTLIYEI